MKILITCILMATLCTGRTAKADDNVGIYAGVGTNFQFAGNLNLGLRLRLLKYCPFGLEITAMAPYGLEMAAPLYFLKTEHLKLHVILPYAGVRLFKTPQRISVRWMTMDIPDIVVGLGAEWRWDLRRFRRGFNYITVNADWRAFIPEPFTMHQTFGDHTTKLIKQSLKESELWLGITLWY